jgi:DNA polymerase-3 subunit epsilon
VNAAIGYAVVDTETTGILPGFKHRIAEIAVIQLDADGTVTGEWSTLLNPDRDLGPQAIHGIRAAEIRHAPRFPQIAGELCEQLHGRIVVSHNWPFDAMHLHAEFDRMGLSSPFHPQAGLCTMRAADIAMPHAGRALIDCCTAAEIPQMRWHTARDDAMAAAMLLKYLLENHPGAIQLNAEHLHTARFTWPNLPRDLAAPVHRNSGGHVEPHFLARLVERLPHDDDPMVDAYFGMLDDALLDRHISATEADALIELAHELGLHKAQAIAAHHTYLRELARAAWSDGVITPTERQDLNTVATLLGLDPGIVDSLLEEEHPQNGGVRQALAKITTGGLALRPGDKIVLTGTMQRPRPEITRQASVAGLRITTAVSRQTRLLVAADPDSLSGKAKTARTLGVPVVNEDAFLTALDAMPLTSRPA